MCLYIKTLQQFIQCMVVENKNFIINLILLKEKHSNIIKKQKETILRVIKILKKFIYFYFLN